VFVAVFYEANFLNKISQVLLLPCSLIMTKVNYAIQISFISKYCYTHTTRLSI